jgi:dTMP kinase
VAEGRIIAFEGVDGAGKSTALALVAEALRAQGQKVFLPRTGKDHASRPVRAIRDITRDRRNLALDPQAELHLYCAREAQVLAELVRPALARGELVLVDRSLLTAEVLGRARGLSSAACAAVARSAAAELEPDLTIVFDVHPRTSRLRKQLAKIRSHSEERGGRKGLAGTAFKHGVRDNYTAIAAERGYPVLHCERATPNQLAERSLQLIEHGASAVLGETERDLAPMWQIAGATELGAALEDVPDAIALLLGAGLIAARTKRARMAGQEPALCAYTLDADDPLRADLASSEPGYALRGLTGKPLEGEGDLRVRLMAHAPAACIAALKHVVSADADVLRQSAAGEHPDEVLSSLTGRRDERALELRNRCAPRASDRALAAALEHVGDDDAWALRDALFERDPAYGVRSLRGLRDARANVLLWRYARQAPAAVLEALSGRDDAEAYRLREALVTCPQEAIDSVRGLADLAAWSLRERWVERLPSNVAYSLLDLPFDGRAQGITARCAAVAAGDLHVLRRIQALREQDAAPSWVKARRRRASTEKDE